MHFSIHLHLLQMNKVYNINTDTSYMSTCIICLVFIMQVVSTGGLIVWRVMQTCAYRVLRVISLTETEVARVSQNAHLK